MLKPVLTVLLASLLTLCGRPLMAGPNDAARDAPRDEAARFTEVYNVSRDYAYKYFLSYREKYLPALRMHSLLEACDMSELARQMAGDLPNVAAFVDQQLHTDSNPMASALLRDGLGLSVALAAQSLTEGYEGGYSEAFRSESSRDQSCRAVANVYDEYLKHKAK